MSFPSLTAALYENYLNLTCPAPLSLRKVGKKQQHLAYCKMFPLGVSVTVNINHSYVFISVELGMREAYVHVCVCV